MDREGIIKLAREANACADGRLWLMYAEDLEIFFNLATATEREACAKVCDGVQADMVTGTPIEAFNFSSKHCAEAIRARGQA